MEQEDLIDLYDGIIKFIHESYYELLHYNLETDNIRIAFPEYLERFFNKGMCLKMNTTRPLHIKEIIGIKIHPTWENSITVYETKSSIFRKTPVFKLSFEMDVEDYLNDKKVIIIIKKFYSYKL